MWTFIVSVKNKQKIYCFIKINKNLLFNVVISIILDSIYNKVFNKFPVYYC